MLKNQASIILKTSGYDIIKELKGYPMDIIKLLSDTMLEDKYFEQIIY